MAISNKTINGKKLYEVYVNGFPRSQRFLQLDLRDKNLVQARKFLQFFA